MASGKSRTPNPGLVSCILLATVSGGNAQGASGKSLEEVYFAALEQSETLATQVELVHQAEERLRQSQAALLPTVNGVISYSAQEDVNSANSIARSISPGNQWTGKLTLSQPLFRGLREFATIRQRKTLIGAQESGRERAEQLLFMDLVQSFYNVMLHEADHQNLKRQISINESRLEELKALHKLGRAREAEVLAVEALLANLSSQIETAFGQIQVARESLAFLSGMDRQIVLSDELPAPGAVKQLQEYLASIAALPEIRAAQLELEAAEQGVSISRGIHLPSLDLLGNYYISRPDGALKDIGWDASLNLTIPIFAGGAVQSQVRATTSERRVRELSLNRARRQTEQEIRSQYAVLMSQLQNVSKLEVAEQISQRSYSLQKRDFSQGRATNLEVLQASDAYEQTRRTLSRARYNVKVELLKLEASVGHFPRQKKQVFQ